MQLHRSLLTLTLPLQFSTMALLFPTMALAQTELVVEYDAGLAGNPATAPSPTAQGWTLRVGNGSTALNAVSPDGLTGRNAWQISDTSTSANSGASYNGFIAQNDIILAAARGWTLDVDARLIASGAIDTSYFEYAEGRQPGDKRYLVYMGVSGLDVILSPWGGTPRVCPLAMDGNYHTFGIRQEPGFALAELIYDGVSIGTFGSINSAAGAVDGGVAFGAGSSTGSGIININGVRFGLLRNLIGQSFCSPAQDNSTGFPAEILASGSSNPTHNDVQLTARQLPLNTFGFFLNAPFQGFASNPGGSAGDLCLGNPIGRHSTQAMNSGASGQIDLTLDLTQLPRPTGPVAVQAGETWYFQCWFRDANPNVTSNFSNGVRVTFP